jgi:hypothetical protein
MVSLFLPGCYDNNKFVFISDKRIMSSKNIFGTTGNPHAKEQN